MTSSSTSSANRLYDYDVFLSFRGPDTRETFINHLYSALVRNEIATFIEDELDRGGEIKPFIMKAIEASKISVVVLSKSYTSSPYCLDELVKILECQKLGQMVCPIFYDVDPSDVDQQMGIFSHRFKADMEKWKNALSEVCALKYWDKIKYRTEAELIGKVVKYVKKLSYSITDHLVGIKSRSEEILSLLGNLSHDESHLIGIFGMPGVGKTTLAEFIYCQISDKFERSCFVRNVRVESVKQGIENLRETLAWELSGYLDVQSHVLERKKVLLVLDDIKEPGQINDLTWGKRMLGRGSIVIVTSRYKEVLKCCEETYEVKALSNTDALQLLIMRAFKQYHYSEDYAELAKRVVNCAQGVPLALEVLGSHLCDSSPEEWEVELNQLNHSTDPAIQRILVRSYDADKLAAENEESPGAESQLPEEFQYNSYIFHIEHGESERKWYISDDITTDCRELCKVPLTIPIHGSPVIVGNFIYYCGGRFTSSKFYSSNLYLFDILNPGKGWIKGPSMNANRLRPACVSVDEKVYVFGGHSYHNYPIAEVFDPNSKSWEPLISVPLHHDLIYKNKFTLLGKYEREILLHICDQIFAYNVDTECWSLRVKNFSLSPFIWSKVHENDIYFLERENSCLRYTVVKSNGYTDRESLYTLRFSEINDVPLLLDSIDLCDGDITGDLRMPLFHISGVFIQALKRSQALLTHIFTLKNSYSAYHVIGAPVSDMHFERILFKGPLYGQMIKSVEASDKQLHLRILNQIEYYFSDQNLIRDLFLRQNMDDYGWVPIELIAGFSSVFHLTDSNQVILDAIKNSSIVEVKSEEASNDWMRWVLPPSGHSATPPVVGADVQSMSLEKSTSQSSGKSEADVHEKAFIGILICGSEPNQNQTKP